MVYEDWKMSYILDPELLKCFDNTNLWYFCEKNQVKVIKILKVKILAGLSVCRGGISDGINFHFLVQ